MTAHTRSSFHLRTLCLQFIICLLLATVCLPHRITAKPNRVKHQHHLHPLHQHKGQGQYESLITSASKTNSSTTTASTASHLKVQQTHTSSTNANASVSASARASANTNASALAAVAGPPRQLVKRDTINYLYRMASSSVHRRTPRAAVFLSSCLRTPQCALQPVPTSTKPTDHMKSSVAKMAQSLGTSVPSSGKQVKSVTGPDSIPALPSGVSSKDTSSLLFKSALYNDIDELKFLHNRKFNVDKVDPNGDTALLAASFQGHSKSIDFLIRHGADVHKKNSAGISPLTVLQARHPALVSTVLRLVGTEETQVEERAAALGLTPSAPSADNKALANRATNALAVHVDPPRSLAVYTYVACSTLNEATGPGSKAVGTDEKTVLLQGKLGHNHTSSSSSKSKSNAKATRTRKNGDGDLCPKRIGSYVRQNRLGNGAFGAVWSYKDEKTNEDVVCKFPIMYGGVSDVISAEQQLFEATHGAKTECQNVLKIQLLRKKTGGSKLFLDCYDVGVSTLDEETKTKLKDQAQLSKAYYEGGMKTHDQAGHRFKYNYRDLPTATPYLMMEKGGETNLHTFAIREKLLTNEELPIVLYQALKAIEVLAEGKFEEWSYKFMHTI